MKLAQTKTGDAKPGKIKLYERTMPDGTKVSVPRVSSVLDGIENTDWLENWRKRVGKREADMKRNEAAAFGTRVHALITGSEIVKPTPLEVTCAQAGLDWLMKNVDEVLSYELTLVHPILGFGGTVDAIVRMNNGELAVVDWKTSAKLSPRHNLQTAAYAMLAQYEGYDVTERYVVRLWKNDQAGRVSTRRCVNPRDYDAFKAAAVIWHWRHPGAAAFPGKA